MKKIETATQVNERLAEEAKAKENIVTKVRRKVTSKKKED